MTYGDPPRTVITNDPSGAIYPQSNYVFVDKTWNTTNTNVVVEESDSDSQILIADVCDEIKEMLLEKNRKYGDSALNPSRIFSRSDAIEQIKVRIDDKLTRLRNMQADEDEDVVRDLMGYLVLLLVAQRKEVPAEPVIDWTDWAKKAQETMPAQPWIYPNVPYTAPYQPQYPVWQTYTINHYEDGHSTRNGYGVC